ncbi:MAG: DUF4286 family protein, partial [Flavisolibacter sp.]
VGAPMPYFLEFSPGYGLHQGYLPGVPASHGCIRMPYWKVVRLLEVDDSEGPTYAIQYHARSKSDYNRYMEMHAADMRKKSFEKWGEKFIAFRTLMEVVQ